MPDATCERGVALGGAVLMAPRDRAHLSGVGGEVHAVVGEGNVAEGGVVEVLDAGVVEADVLGGPAGTDIGALGG